MANQALKPPPLADVKNYILYVEDGVEDITLMKYIVKKHYPSASLIVFDNGLQFLDFLEKKNTYKDRDSISGRCSALIDVNLPYLNGLELLERLKAHVVPLIRSVPVIMFSSVIRPVEQQKSQALGATSFMQKPFDYMGMKRVIEVLLNENIFPIQEILTEL